MKLGNIEGLKIKALVRHVSERGDFQEILRHTDDGLDGFAQVSSSLVYDGVAKAWHLHWDQTESMTLLSGVAKFAFCDRRPGSKSFNCVQDFIVDAVANPQVFTVPPGIAHGYRILQGPALVLYFANRLYDPKDQIKIAHNDPEIGYNWKRPEII